jgi:hypothetical protein
MFRLAFLLLVIAVLVLQSLFTQTEHVVEGDVHIYRYNVVPWIFLGVLMLSLVGFAEVARRYLRDRILAVHCLLGIPLFGLVSLQLIYERVEVSDALLVHRREPPHTRFNVDIPWDSMGAATIIEREQAGFLGPSGHTVGYEITLKDGTIQELPSNTVLTSAQEQIDRMLAAHKVPMIVQRIPLKE